MEQDSLPFKTNIKQKINYSNLILLSACSSPMPRYPSGAVATIFPKTWYPFSAWLGNQPMTFSPYIFSSSFIPSPFSRYPYMTRTRYWRCNYYRRYRTDTNKKLSGNIICYAQTKYKRYGRKKCFHKSLSFLH